MPSKLERVVLVVAGATAAICLPAVCVPAVQAEIISMAPHEKAYSSPAGNFMVGNREEQINRIPPLNMVGTSREVLVSNIAYGRLEEAPAGKLKVGYHVGCAIQIGAGTVGTTPDIIPVPTPSFNFGPVATVNLLPGEITDVPIQEKAMITGKNIQLITRDFHIRVNACTGPVTLRQYTYVQVNSPEVDDSGAVFGDPTWF